MAPRNRGATDPAEQRQLLGPGDVARTVARMAHQIIEKAAIGAEATGPPGVVLLGIPTRGAPLACHLDQDRARRR